MLKNGYYGHDGPSSLVLELCPGNVETVGGSTAMAATSLGDPLEPADHPGHARTLCTGLQPDMVTCI